ncbi:uncharacterized protein K441DRAFT_684426 [Cenococcum geophilum 1.58]|uniref:uncharacterized protein n=1 Tax=Cenococcum geophilum 1.58 TaxID=794803 RepID=UPI00358F54BA|nr:hypothetical protein K441DRAFT_684426 [Cenococcum geophilum 1.58]
MSGYGKSQQPYVYEEPATRPNQNPSYASFAQPSFASQYSDAQARVPHEPSTTEMPFIPSSTYESRGAGSYQAQFPFIDARSRHLPGPPEITSYLPSKGGSGDKLLINLRAKYDLTIQQNTFFSIMFGSRRCETALTKLEPEGEYFNYTLATDIPPHAVTACLSGQMQLLLNMEDEYSRILDVFEVGDFTYTDVSAYQTYSSSQDLSRKRKISAESLETPDYLRSPAKRVASQRLYAKPRESSSVYPIAHSSVSPAASYVQPALPSNFSYSGAYERVQQPQVPVYPQQNPQQKGLYSIPSGINISQPNVKAQSPSQPTYSPYSTVSQTGRSPASIAATPARTPVMPSPASLANPPLIRTSTIQPPSSAVTPVSVHPQSFNPYAMYPNSKAVLKIDGDLEKMAEGWSQDEWDAKRRLVQFRRSQSGSTITTLFEAVTPEERSPHSICVSCILWEEKQECFITSVDTIFLLESLVAVRFTVEEKNRIRRNLEGFRPLTVSKAKAESEEFFKVIMGFPNPKPRNIEKDVKVFPWKILAHALKKIISKYSASYSSTAGALLTPVSSSYGSGGPSEAAPELHRNTSPRSVSSSVASTAYTSGMTSTTLSPNIKASAGLEASAGQSDLRVSVPQLTPTVQSMTPWQAAAHHPASQYSAGLSTTGRTSWDYGAFLEPSAATAVPGSGQSLQLQRADVAPQASQVAGNEAYQQYGQRTSRG